MLHDPHMIPEPILVVSGLTYLLPAYIAVTKGRTYDAATYFFLTCTTVGFHGTRSETIFALDIIAIMNFLGRSYQLSQEVSIGSVWFLNAAITYSLVSYFVGAYLKAMSFDPDWNTQMIFHSTMHLLTAAASYKIMSEV